MDTYRRITIDLPVGTLDRLRDVADRERRSPRDQAALIVQRAVARAAIRTLPHASRPGPRSAA